MEPVDTLPGDGIHRDWSLSSGLGIPSDGAVVPGGTGPTTGPASGSHRDAGQESLPLQPPLLPHLLQSLSRPRYRRRLSLGLHNQARHPIPIGLGGVHPGLGRAEGRHLPLLEGRHLPLLAVHPGADALRRSCPGSCCWSCLSCFCSAVGQWSEGLQATVQVSAAVSVGVGGARASLLLLSLPCSTSASRRSLLLGPLSFRVGLGDDLLAGRSARIERVEDAGGQRAGAGRR